MLEKLANFLRYFEHATKFTEGRDGRLWQFLPAMDYLVNLYKKGVEESRSTGDRVWGAMYEIGWSSLDTYFELADDSPAYVMAVVLHPTHKWDYFNTRWKKEWVDSAVPQVKEFWELNYKPAEATVSRDDINPAPDFSKDSFDGLGDWMAGSINHDAMPEYEDEYERYCKQAIIKLNDDPQAPPYWWLQPQQRAQYPNLHVMAIDILSIPPMSAEPERLFSSAKRTITDERHRLGASAIEAIECLKCVVLS
jgi:hypothetical protein